VKNWQFKITFKNDITQKSKKVTERENMDFTAICCQINVLQRSVLLSLVQLCYIN